MTKTELEQLFGSNLGSDEIILMASTWSEWDVNQYLIDTGYEADCKDVIISLRREAKIIEDQKDYEAKSN